MNLAEPIGTCLRGDESVWMPLKPPHVLDLPGVDPVDGVLSAGTLVLVDHACVEDGANAITEEHRAGRYR